MKKYIAVCCSLFCVALHAQVTTITPGKFAPGINLKNVDDKVVSFDGYPSAKGFIVIFTCNTCPYSKRYEQRIINLNNKYAPLGFPVIAVNPNDPVSSPGDSFEEMKKHALSAKFNFPYLYDEGQLVTTAYGARNTPHVFVISKTPQGNIVEYTGAIDNNTENADAVATKYVEAAVDALLSDTKPTVTVTKAIGCRISWKKI
ncbi:MAG: thioredoxin family protein [Panacibacter sp.]